MKDLLAIKLSEATSEEIQSVFQEKRWGHTYGGRPDLFFLYRLTERNIIKVAISNGDSILEQDPLTCSLSLGKGATLGDVLELGNALARTSYQGGWKGEGLITIRDVFNRMAPVPPHATCHVGWKNQEDDDEVMYPVIAYDGNVFSFHFLEKQWVKESQIKPMGPDKSDAPAEPFRELLSDHFDEALNALQKVAA